jgi:hypothetical protein
MDNPSSSSNTTTYDTGAHNMTPLASLGGQVLAVAVHGNYAYVGFGSRLAVFDASNPAEMIEVASLILNDKMIKLVPASQYVYVLTAREGMYIIDISDPLHPKNVGDFGDYYGTGGYYASDGGSDLAVADGFAYITTNSGWVIVDVSDPLNPSKVALHGHQTDFRSVVLSGSLAYIYENNAGLRIFDVADPLAPVPVGLYPIVYSFDAVSLVVEDNDLYMLLDSIGLQILDVSNPAEPALVGEFQMTGEYPLNEMGRDIALSGSYAYLAWETLDIFTGFNQGGLMVIDVSDPANPFKVGSTTSPGTYFGIALAGDYALLTRQNFIIRNNAGNIYGGDLQVVDVSDPSAPAIAAKISNLLNKPGSIAVEGSYAYIADNYAEIAKSSIYVMDVSTPTSPVVLGAFQSPGIVQDVEVAGNIAYLAEADRLDASGQSVGGGFRILDVSNPMSPVEIGFFDDEAGQFRSVEVQGSYAYLTWQGECQDYLCTGRLRVLDISDPANLEEVGVYESTGIQQGMPFNVFIQGNYSYIAAWTSFWIVDISDPDRPRGISKTEICAGADVAVANGYANLAYSLGGICILSIEDPANPVIVAQKFLIGNILRVAIEGNILYAAGAPWDILVYDISNPTNLVELASYPSQSGDVDLKVSDGVIYYTNDEEGMLILKLTSRINGVVRHANRLPVPGVTVTVNSAFSTTTSGEGTYKIEDLDAGNYTLVPSLPGYAFNPSLRQYDIPPDTAANFTILPLPVSAELTLEAATTLVYTDTQGLPTRFIFPSGLVSTTATATVTPTLASPLFGLDFAGHAFDLSIRETGSPTEILTFTLPVSITIHYSPRDTAVIADPMLLALYRREGDAWVKIHDTCSISPTPVHVEPGLIHAVICQSGRYALFGPTHAVALPYVSFGSYTGGSPPPGPVNVVSFIRQ